MTRMVGICGIATVALATLLTLLLVAAPVSATPLEITSGNMGGYPHHDLAFLLYGADFSIGGYEVFPLNLGPAMAAGFYMNDILVNGYNGNWGVLPVMFMHFEFTFVASTFLLQNPRDPGVAGTSISLPMTMTGALLDQYGGILSTYRGQGTIAAAWFTWENPSFPGPSFGATFTTAQPSGTFAVPEPHATTLLLLGLTLVLGCSRRVWLKTP